MRRITALMLLAAAAALQDGCATKPATSGDAIGAAPADFSLDVSVLRHVAAQSGNGTGSSAAPLECSRFVLLPDGSLCHARVNDENRGANWLPPLTRVLSRQQVAEVWSLAKQLGLVNLQAADPNVNPALVRPQDNEIVYLAALTGGGEHWNFIRRSRLDEPPDTALERLANALGSLAWAGETEQTHAKTLPRRYDFGPDPYARYRQQ